MNRTKSCLADPYTLLGMLQRGRGAGYLLALETAPKSVWPLLGECITNDPRLDKQVEDRADYYGSLIIETEMDITPLGDYLRQNDGPDDQFWNINLAIETLVGLSACHNTKALRLLQEYLSYGFHWQDTIIDLWAADVDGALDGVDLTICDRLSNDPVFRQDFESGILEDSKYGKQSDGMLLPGCEPWKTLCLKNAEFAKVFKQLCPPEALEPLPAVENKAPADLTGLSIEELFTLVERPDRPLLYRIFEALERRVSREDEELLLRNLSREDEYRAKLALKGLGALGTPTAFEAVRTLIESSEGLNPRIRSQAFRAIGEMPASLTLETGRKWFQQDQWYLQVAGGEILENHATPDDVPLLVDALRTPKTIQCEDFRLSSALEAFWLLDGIGHIPEIENVFVVVPHSYKRYRAAWAMETTAPHVFQTMYAYECLWDCHWDTRICGCETASLSQPGVLARLKELADDPNESKQVRQAARLAIDEF